jgi:hypothetical protein
MFQGAPAILQCRDLVNVKCNNEKCWLRLINFFTPQTPSTAILFDLIELNFCKHNYYIIVYYYMSK